MSEVKSEGLGVVDVRAIVTDAFISMMESALSMKAPDCAPPPFIQSAIDRAIDRINSEALAGYAVLRERIATQEAQIKVLQSDANSWQSGYDEGRRMGAKHCMGTIYQLRAELAASREQVPFAWSEFDGEDGYDFRLYEDSETFRDDFIARNGGKYADWVRPLYAAPIPDAMEGVDWLMHLFADHFPDSAKPVEVEVFAEWLRDNASALQAGAMVVPDRSKEFSQFLTSVITAAGLLAYGKQSKGLASYLSDKALMYMLAAIPSAKEGGV